MTTEGHGGDSEKMRPRSEYQEQKKFVEHRESEPHPNYLKAKRAEGAVQLGNEVWLYISSTAYVVEPNGEGAYHSAGHGAHSFRSVEEMGRLLEGTAESSQPDLIYRALRGDQIPFFARLREYRRHGAMSAAVALATGRVVSAEFDGKTMVMEYESLGLIIGKKGSNIKPLREACRANGIELVVRLTAEAEKKRQESAASMEKNATEARARFEATKPEREARQTQEAAEERKRQKQRFLARKDFLQKGLDRALSENRDDDAEKIYQMLLKADEELGKLS